VVFCFDDVEDFYFFLREAIKPANPATSNAIDPGSGIFVLAKAGEIEPKMTAVRERIANKFFVL
jgi:hypothetical protein